MKSRLGGEVALGRCCRRPPAVHHESSLSFIVISGGALSYNTGGCAYSRMQPLLTFQAVTWLTTHSLLDLLLLLPELLLRP